MAHDFSERLFATIDRLDAAGFAGRFTADAVFVFGNAEPLHGPEAVAAGVGAFFDSIASLRHDITREFVADGTHVVEALVTYGRHDGKTLSVPAVSIYRRAGDHIDDYRIFVDLAPLYA